MEPLLKRYHADALHVDIKEVLINHLVENQLDYTQQVDWKELTKLAKFAGTTPTYLRITYQNLRTGTKRRYPGLSREELNTGAILRYLGDRGGYKNKNEGHHKMLIEFYVTNILSGEKQ